MQGNLKNKPQYYAQTFQENDFVRNSFQKQHNNYYDSQNNKSCYRNTSPIKSMHPYQNLVSPKHNSKTPFFSSPYGRNNQNFNLNFISSKKQQFANKYDQTQNMNALQNNKKYFQMQTTISQLKISLHQSLDNQNKLQQQLHHQKTKNFQLFQLKRRLQEQLTKMQFQLDRINNYDNLQQRQAVIKRQSVQAENQSLSKKIDNLHEQLKKIKMQHRDLMTQYNQSLNQCQILDKQNKLWVQKVELLESELNYSRKQIKKEQFYKSEEKVKGSFNHNKHQQNNNFQAINEITTTRTSQEDNQYGYKSHSTTKSNSNGQQSYNNAYQLQNSKLIQDYQKLLIENQSLKKLCQEFYQPSTNLKSIQTNERFNKTFQNSNQVCQIPIQTNKLLNQDDDMLRTYQRKNIQSQVNNLRQKVINQLITKYYQKTLKQSKRKNKNCLLVFISQISHKIEILDKMVLNYLMARDILNKETLNNKQQSFSKDDTDSIQFQELAFKVKQNLKNELKKNKQKINNNQVLCLNINSYFLALFRLLTLIYRGNSNNSQNSKYMKHLCLKYIHKIADQRRKM